MRKLLIAVSLVTLAPILVQPAQALEFNLLAGANVWDAGPSGEIQGLKNETPLQVKSSLGLEDENQTNIFIQFDHPVPVIPNFRISSTELEFSGTKTAQLDFMGQSFNGELNSLVDLSHTDFTAYYRFLDGITSFIPLVGLRVELGLTLRQFAGEFSVAEAASGTKESLDLDVIVPMGYAGLRVSLPLGLSVGANVNAIGYSGNSLTDVTADLRYQYDGLPLIKPGINLGYRSFDAKLDDLDDTYGDLSLSGVFAGAYVRVGF